MHPFLRPQAKCVYYTGNSFTITANILNYKVLQRFYHYVIIICNNNNNMYVTGMTYTVLY